MIDLKSLTIQSVHESYKRGDYTPTDLTRAYLDNIKEKNPDLNAYLEVFEKDALDQAKIAEEMFKNGTASILTGIPIALKDNMLYEGHIASASSKMLGNYISSYDATVVAKLKSQGAIFLGRTNMDEFAMGSSTQTSAYGITRNPIDRTRVPGGSSGGAASALASDMALVSLGTETCGSIRQPASFCGLVGFKPTYGEVSRSGIIAMGSSLDQVGPLTKTVEETEIIFNSIRGYDPLDSTSIPEDVKIKYEKTALKKKIGIPRSFLNIGGLDPKVLENFNQICDKLKNSGYELVDIELPTMKYSLAVYYILMPAEVSSNLARYDGIRYGHHENGANLMEVYKKSRGKGFGREVRRRILLGTYILSHGYHDAYYNKALKVRDAIDSEMQEAFLSIDAIMTPTVPFQAFKLGEKMDDPMAMYICDIFSAPANLAGLPAISVPSGFNEEGLPYGVQMMSNTLREDILFAIGKDIEKLV